jgi:flagellar biosynthesis protein FlhB
MSTSNDDEFMGFNPNNSKPKPPAEDPVKYSSPTNKTGEVSTSTDIFLWGGIFVALIGFVSFIVFVLGAASTFWAFMKIKSEAEFGNDTAKRKLASGKIAVAIIAVLLPFRFIVLAFVGV